MGNPLLGVPWESCALVFAPDPALDAEARRSLGVVPSWTGYFSSNP